MKKLFFILFAFATFCANAQNSLRIVVTDVATKKLDDIYVAGSFNKWQPNDEKFKLLPFGKGRRAIVIKNLAAATYSYKITRGSWDKVEVTAKGADIANREANVVADTSQEIVVAGWKDDYPEKPKPYTATAQVQLMDSAFVMPQLNRTRKIWIYLPKSYASMKGKKYPVLYMHDAQNLFNEQIAPYGEWGIDECLDSLQKQTGKECIVVGIEHGDSKRLTEYNPYDNKEFGKGEGKQYLQFIVETLKPFIDKKYRTLADAKHTSIAGSSMGGLISTYALFTYPTVFGSAGIFSPAYWTAPNIFSLAQSFTSKTIVNGYFYVGGKEIQGTVNLPADMEAMLQMLNKNPYISTRKSVYPLGVHKEGAWREEFDDFYKWWIQQW